MTVLEKALGEKLNTALRTLKEWDARMSDDKHLYALHTLGYAECLAERFAQAGLAERLSMRANIERIEYEISVLAETDE